MVKIKKENLQTNFFKYWLPLICWGLVMFLFSAKPTSSTSEIYWEDFFVKKTAHIVEYFVFTFLAFRALLNTGVNKIKAGYISILVAFIFAATDEFHQSFTPGRDPTLRDVLFDTIGATLAVYVIWNYLPKAPKKLKSLAKSLRVI